MTNTLTNLAEATDILDIRPPVAIPDYWLWVWIAGLALAVLGVALWLIRRALRRRREIPAAPLIPAHVRARRRLEEALALIGSPKPFVIEVSDTLRAYLEEALALRAPERTTEEFLVDLQGSARLADPQKEQLADFLRQSDLVKFARYEPTEQHLRALHRAALELVAQTEPSEVPSAATERESPSSIVHRPSSLS